ncbi:MAG: tRNA-dihydrouridine synthase family protein [Lachnospiraceae bacterium]|nr:tRNA-dihydrouridine synthase family protein [Lachnospiraceae bacterium]
MMDLYFAPLEGIGNHIYRNTYRKHYEGVDRFYTPFIDVNSVGEMKRRNLNDVLPENNRRTCIVPQLLIKNAVEFKGASVHLMAFGYDEVNINMGCPYGTVVKKGKGAGLLSDTDNLRRLLSEIIPESPMKVSVKMRIGIDDPETGCEIMEVLNEFPLSEVIIHPRLQKEFYEGAIHEDVLKDMYGMSENPVAINPGISCPADFFSFSERYPGVTGIMIGRKLVSNPEMAERIKNGEMAADNLIMDRRRFEEFHDDLLCSYVEVLSGDTPVLFKMKELWDYWKESLCPDEKVLKKIKKASDLSTYRILAKAAIN